MHRLLFMPNGLPDGAELAYYVKGQVSIFCIIDEFICNWFLFFSLSDLFVVCFRNYLEATNREMVLFVVVVIERYDHAVVYRGQYTDVLVDAKSSSLISFCLFFYTYLWTDKSFSVWSSCWNGSPASTVSRLLKHLIKVHRVVSSS